MFAHVRSDFIPMLKSRTCSFNTSGVANMDYESLPSIAGPYLDRFTHVRVAAVPAEGNRYDYLVIPRETCSLVGIIRVDFFISGLTA